MLKVAYILLTIFLTSCNSLSQNNNNTEKEYFTPKDTISYVYKSFKDISQYLVSNEDKTDTAYFAISYPEFEDLGLNEAVRPYILLDGDSSIQQASENFIMSYNEFVEENSTKYIFFPWYKNVVATVWINTPLVLTLSTFVDEYTGGAHGLHYNILSNIDVTTKRKIELKDIIQKEKMKDFTKKAETLFRKLENLSQNESLEDKFFFENGIFALNDNFGLTKSNLVFYFNEYEIKPYAEGPTTLEIPYEEIDEFLSPQGKTYVASLKNL